VTLPTSPAGPLISKLVQGQLDRFRESVDSVMGSLNLLHLAYWHVSLLIIRHSSSCDPLRLLDAALRVASLLDSPSTPITPLNHHFAALAGLTLVELVDLPETKDGAWAGIDALLEALEKRRGIAVDERSIGWDSAIRDLVLKKKQHQGQGGPSSSTSQGGLQHLADLATGATGSVSQSEGAPQASDFDFTVLTRYGYLTALVGGNAPR
jgi:hypothetical protein